MQSFIGRHDLVVELLGIMVLVCREMSTNTTKQWLFSNFAIILKSMELKLGSPLCLIKRERHTKFHRQTRSGCWVVGDHSPSSPWNVNKQRKTVAFQQFCFYFGEYGAETWLTSLSHSTRKACKNSEKLLFCAVCWHFTANRDHDPQQLNNQIVSAHQTLHAFQVL